MPQRRPGAGGAFVLSQKWVHDLEAFRALPIPEQECVIGRTKADSIELEGAAMPATSHVSRTDVKVDGVAQKIYRRSTPFGGAAELGLYFLAFACELPRVVDRYVLLLNRQPDDVGVAAVPVAPDPHGAIAVKRASHRMREVVEGADPLRIARRPVRHFVAPRYASTRRCPTPQGAF